MNMGTSSMVMSMATKSAGAVATSTASSMSGMGGMDMGGDSSMPSCNMEMIWNWNVIDDCLIAGSWHITSKAMFAGSCIGVICFVIALEFVRRLSREYDRLIVRKWKAKRNAVDDPEIASGNTLNEKLGFQISSLSKHFAGRLGDFGSFSPTLFEHCIRSILYAMVVGASYILMLLAMSFNGYIIICIIIGALLGFFFFGSDNITDGLNQESGISCC